MPFAAPHPFAVGLTGGFLNTASWPGFGHRSLETTGVAAFGRMRKPSGTGMSLRVTVPAGMLSTTTLLFTIAKLNSGPLRIPAETPPSHCTLNILWEIRQRCYGCTTTGSTYVVTYFSPPGPAIHF
jgi:hypothetical protein